MAKDNNYNDKVYTPDFIVDEVLEKYLPEITRFDTVLEPFRGKGAFYDKLPEGRKYWCEIDDGVDFMDWDTGVDWIITNPPYSTFKTMLDKMLKISDNVVMVIPIAKLLSSMPRLMDIQRNGHNIKAIHYHGSGRQLKFPFGFPVASVHTQRGYHGAIDITYSDRCMAAKSL